MDTIYERDTDGKMRPKAIILAKKKKAPAKKPAPVKKAE